MYLPLVRNILSTIKSVFNCRLQHTFKQLFPPFLMVRPNYLKQNLAYILLGVDKYIQSSLLKFYWNTKPDMSVRDLQFFSFGLSISRNDGKQ